MNVKRSMPMGWLDISKENRPNKSSSSSGTKRIVFVGKLTEEKGAHILFEAIHMLNMERNAGSIKFDVLGDGPLYEAGALQFSSLASNIKVQFHGWIDEREVVLNILKDADILICPSTYPEGMPRVIEEAMACDVNVIASNIGGINDEFHDKEVLFFETGNAQDLASCIVKLIEDEQLSNCLKYHANKRIIELSHYVSAAHQHSELLLKAQ